MKRFFALCLVFGFCAVLAGCGSEEKAANKAAQTSRKTINDILAESQANDTTPVKTIEYPDLDYSAEVDLTKLNSTMIYSTVYAMVSNPSEYTGKTVKANGTFDVFTDPETGSMFYSCMIADATACCKQGLEFEWEGEHSFPDDYPKVGTPLTVGGEFETYKEKGQTYCRLKHAQVVF